MEHYFVPDNFRRILTQSVGLPMPSSLLGSVNAILPGPPAPPAPAAGSIHGAAWGCSFTGYNSNNAANDSRERTSHCFRFTSHTSFNQEPLAFGFAGVSWMTSSVHVQDGVRVRGGLESSNHLFGPQDESQAFRFPRLSYNPGNFSAAQDHPLSYATQHHTADNATTASGISTDALPKMDQTTGSTARATRFRFKGEKTCRTDHTKPKRAHPDEEETQEPKRRRHSNRPDTDPNESAIGPDVAFRESLFDALADNEGAAYWEGIYGQPIHMYSRPTKYNPATSTHEPVSDDAYAAHVRQKMWERTHAGALEQMQRRRKQYEERMAQAREQNARRKAVEEEEARLNREMEQALRRGEMRRRVRAYKDGFARYTASWETWDGQSQDSIPWPTGSGTRENVTEKTVRSFFTNGIGAAPGSSEFAARLKEQRVRWHPDKMQQKLGGKDKVTKGVMADITMIFQVIDTLYRDCRETSNGGGSGI